MATIVGFDLWPEKARDFIGIYKGNEFKLLM